MDEKNELRLDGGVALLLLPVFQACKQGEMPSSAKAAIEAAEVSQ